MKIEDVEVGMKVKLISTFHTDDELGYCEDLMLSVGGVGEVIYVDDDNNVKLSDNYWYSVKDLEPYSEAQQNSDNTNIGNLTVSISLEDKREIAKDILKIVLNDFNKVISDTIAQLDVDDSEDEVDNVIEIKQAENVLEQFSDQKMTEIVEQALKEAFKETFFKQVIIKQERIVLFKDYVKDLVELLNDNPEYGDLEVWTYSDDEGNSILPAYSGCTLGYVVKGVTRETDEYSLKEYLKDSLEYYEISLEDFKATRKEIILL